MPRGDILTVVIEIDDSAEISNATDRSRSGQSATLHDTEVFGVAVIGESESSDGLDLAKGTVH
ncbi:hypothetical protein ACFOHK_01385 [Falsigemmobacter intermedius]|uniref:hypothetical protein n=1 Tax=Falsigemmobacter intermedius TaxID=1553448 RepID=UPI0035EF86F0